MKDNFEFKDGWLYIKELNIAVPTYADKIVGKWEEENYFPFKKAITYVYDSPVCIEAIEKCYPNTATDHMSATVVAMQILADYFSGETCNSSYWIKKGFEIISEHIACKMMFVI